MGFVLVALRSLVPIDMLGNSQNDVFTEFLVSLGRVYCIE